MNASKHPRLPTAGLFLLALSTACTTVGPDYVPPELQLPASWQQARQDGMVDGDAADAAWWRRCDDPLLGQLIETALQQNLDLRVSLLRLQSARAMRGIAAAGAWPTIDARASYEHREESLNTPLGEFIPNTDIHSISLDAAWELDLWGRVRRSVEAADRDLQASYADVHAAAMSVAAEVGRSYVDLRAAQRRLELARNNLQLQERTLELVRAREAAGLVRERDVAQAATNVETTRSRLPQLQASTAAAANRLAVLLGRAPGDLPVALGESGALPQLPTTVAVGTPVDLLRRRPDVQAAERRFAAEVARVGVAEADRYPRFSLTGTFGVAADGADGLFDADSLVSGIGPSVRWNLFDGGRLKNRVAALQASAEAAQVSYEQTVLLAIEETENAMTRFVREQSRRESLERAATEARRAVTLAQAQYSEGLSDFQTVLDSERIVATIEDDLATSDATVATNLISLFLALGGTDGLSSVPIAAR